MSSIDSTFAALSDPIRRSILARLGEGPARCNELVALFDVSQQAVSRHIGVLREAGLLEQRRRGRERICVLRHGPIAEATDWLAAQGEVWSRRFDRLEGLLHEDKGEAR